MFCLFAFVLCTLVPSHAKNMHILYNKNSLTTYKALTMAASESEWVRRHISQQWLDLCLHTYTYKAKIYMCWLLCAHITLLSCQSHTTDLNDQSQMPGKVSRSDLRAAAECFRCACALFLFVKRLLLWALRVGSEYFLKYATISEPKWIHWSQMSALKSIQVQSLTVS